MILLIAAMLLPLSQAMAAVTITVVVDSNSIVDGNYQAHCHLYYSSDADVRAFALDINTDNGTTLGDTITNFLRGESIDPSIVPGKAKGYGIFPGRFRDFINPSVPDWDDANYMPVTPWAAPGAENTGLGWPKMVVEMGTLWASGSGDINKPALSGTLFNFDVNSEGAADCNVTVALNALRGGVVGGTADALATNLPATIKIVFPPIGFVVPNCVGGTTAACITAIGTAGFTGGYAQTGVPGTGQAVGTVISQVQPPGPPAIPCNTTIAFSDVNYPIRPTSVPPALYTNWVARGKPQCWAYPRQCRGDATGNKNLQYWVGTSDYALYKSAQGKLESVLPANGICADFTHSKNLQYWVGTSDYALYKSYQGKLESLVPICGNPPDVNYWYWCAPGGVCPNSP